MQASRTWQVAVVAVCLVAGVGFAASARASRGTDLRAPGTADLVGTVRAAEVHVHDLDTQVRNLQRQVDTSEQRAGTADAGVAAAQARVAPLELPAGLRAVHGSGLLVVLDDASGPVPAGVDPNELVVHQSDLQAVVNALWAGGAQAMTVAGQRIIPTSAVRCVGNTLLLNGEVYSPPFRVAAIGPSATMQEQLAASPGVSDFRAAAEYYGLGYTVAAQSTLELPAYGGPITLDYAQAGK